MDTVCVKADYLYSTVIPCFIMATLGLPQRSSYDFGFTSEAAKSDSVTTLKFPHTRAQLSAIARHHKPTDHHDAEPDADDLNRVPSSLVNKVVSLLVDENEDELKALLKETYDLDNESVSVHHVACFFPTQS